MDGKSSFSLLEWKFTDMPGKCYNDSYDNRLELGTSIGTHIWLNIYTDGHIEKYLQIPVYTLINIHAFIPVLSVEKT